MVYDFDQIIPRQGTDSIKWSIFPDDVLPMWVADMDFQSAPAIIEALQARAAHGVFGYAMDVPGLRESICERMQRLYGWTVRPDEIVYLPGVVSGLGVAARAYGAGGVLVQPPVYPPFLTTPPVWEREVRLNRLLEVRDGTHLHYAPDFDDFERQAAQSSMFMLCNPHNPVGHVFTRDELLRMAEISLRHNLVLCSDEIHCDLILGERAHIPLASLDPEISARTITLMAASKSFNIPGLSFAFAIVQNEALRKALRHAAEGVVHLINLMGMVATKAAYDQGGLWLSELLTYLLANRDFLITYCQQNFPGAAITQPDGTYLAWVDFGHLGMENPFRHFLERGRVALMDGASFGDSANSPSSRFVRLNFGCPYPVLNQALDRMRQSLHDLM